MLKVARKYQIGIDSIVHANNQPEKQKDADIEATTDALLKVCRSLDILRLDDAEYALLTAILIFSERPSLEQPEKVDKIQEFYVNTLKTYVDYYRPPNKCWLAQILGILTQLRTLGDLNWKMCMQLRLKKIFT